LKTRTIPRKLVLFLVATAIPLLACGTLSVVNTTPHAAVVTVRMPDEGSGTVYMYSGQSESWYVFSGGPYTVEVKQDTEDYVNGLKALRDQLTDAIFLGEGDSAAQLGDVTEAAVLMAQLSDKIERLSNAGTSCSDNFPDTEFDLYADALAPLEIVVALDYDAATSTWSCK